MCSFIIIGITVNEFRFFNLNKKKKKKKKNFSIAFLLISHPIYNVFSLFSDRRFLLAYLLPECPQM